MINNVSKNINDNNNEHGYKTESITGKKNIKADCISDFPIKTETYTGKYDKKNKNNQANFADASKMRNSTLLLPFENVEESAVSCELTAMSIEKISPTMTTPTKRISETKNRITTSADVTRKSLELWKNKCQAYESNEFSSKRATLEDTTSAFSTIYGSNYSTATTNFQNNKCQCELLESRDFKKTLSTSGLSTPITITQTINPSILSLAERKIKLRSDFFKDITKSEQAFNTDCETEQAKVLKPKKRQLKRCSNLKLKILKEIEENNLKKKTPNITEDTVLKPIEQIKHSLIEARKLELAQKFATQSAIKASKKPKQLQALHEFRRVAQLVKKFDRIPAKKMIVNPNSNLEATTQDDNMYRLKPVTQAQRHSSPLSDEGCNLGQSPYSTDDDEHENDIEDNVSIRTTSTTIETQRSAKCKDKVARSASSDSALGLEVDDAMDTTNTTTTSNNANNTMPTTEQQQRRRMTLTVTDLPLRPALLPLAEPTTLPDSPTPEIPQTLITPITIPSKVLLEERVVEIPEDPLRSVGAPLTCPHANSRRESEQSCFSDNPFGETPGVRYVRTPSVVVSDYSDDVMCGITLEEIEYFRAQRLRRRSSLDVASAEREADFQSDVSAASSCSNLYYCGSTISALDGAECLINGLRVELERKASDCSTCSASGNEDETTSTSSSAFTLIEDINANKDIADLLAAQHLSSKRAKKVGAVTKELDSYVNRI